MLEVKIAGYSDLTDEQQADAPNKGNGKEYSNYIVVTHGGRTVDVYSDAMEPEDAVFYRDLGWIVGAILEAYELGKKDA